MSYVNVKAALKSVYSPLQISIQMALFRGYASISGSVENGCSQYVHLGEACVSFSATSDYLVASFMKVICDSNQSNKV